MLPVSIPGTQSVTNWHAAGQRLAGWGPCALSCRIGTDERTEKARDLPWGLGLFARSRVGLERQAAQAAFSEFLQGATLTANQIEFVTMLIDHLEEFGVVETARLYESPFIDIASQGPDGLFRSDQVDELVAILEGLKASAEAA